MNLNRDWGLVLLNTTGSTRDPARNSTEEEEENGKWIGSQLDALSFARPLQRCLTHTRARA